MPTNRIHVGAVEVIAVSDGELFLQKSFYPDITDDQWSPYPEQLSPDGDVVMNLGSFILRSQGKSILVDTGLGANPIVSWKANSGSLPAQMDSERIPPAEIDMVLLTHLHGDHVGWNVVGDGDDRRLGFPNARYLAPEIDFRAGKEIVETMESDPEQRVVLERRALAFQQQVLPLESLGCLDLIPGEHRVTNEITTVPAPGHTPGHICVVVASQGQRALIIGDVAHMPLEVHHTDWICRGDADPAGTIATRERLLDDAESDDALLLAGHFPAPAIGRLVRTNGRRYWQGI